MNQIDPDMDGIDHINIYSKGKTKLGRFLSNFAYSPFECEDGLFESIEGYWYWLGTSHPERDKLRCMSGFEAKRLGRQLGADDWSRSDPEFKRKILNAIKIKLERYSGALYELRASNLPLKHYYVFGTKVHTDDRSNWMLEFIESMRK